MPSVSCQQQGNFLALVAELHKDHKVFVQALLSSTLFLKRNDSNMLRISKQFFLMRLKQQATTRKPRKDCFVLAPHRSQPVLSAHTWHSVPRKQRKTHETLSPCASTLKSNQDNYQKKTLSLKYLKALC